MIDKSISYHTYDELLDLMKKGDREFNIELIDKAYNFAQKEHEGQIRRSGCPYILHPISVAYILAELGMDTESVMAALLHDVVEDTSVTISTIKKEFGSVISNLIDGVTKIGKIRFLSREEEQAENLRKMLMAMAKDVRVIIIKLADRLNNMRTISCMPEQKQRDKALENMEIYAPIAHRLGIRGIKEELEDISLRCLDAVAYREIENYLALEKDEREKFIEKIISRLKEGIVKYIPEVYLTGRVKSATGIYRKVYMKNKQIEEIFDIYAVRIIINSINDCYNVLGIIHDMYKPIPNRFKDYISTPKPNMYQSLHTTVIGKEGIPFEIQIRTWEMHHTAEYGIAAHWRYKLGLNVTGAQTLDDRLTWVQHMIKNQQESDDVFDFVNTIKSDLVPEDIYVFSPKGEVFDLPTGSTVIDFAYAIHSEVGNKMVGAKVDKRIVPIDYKVKTGEIVEIITREYSKGPSRDWLKIVKTSEARNKIKQWFKREKREENIVEGKNIVEREFKRNGIKLAETKMQEFLKAISKKQHRETIEEFYEAIGYGGIQLWRILPRIKDDYAKLKKIDALQSKQIEEGSTHRKIFPEGVIVEGVDNCLVKFSKCCNPLPGDEVVGFITRGSGVSIHKKNCSNVPDNFSNCREKARWVNAYWAQNVKKEFKSTLEIISYDRAGLLADIFVQLSNMKIYVNSFNTHHKKNGTVALYITIIVGSTEHLQSIMSMLMKIKDVVQVKRSGV